jgi:Tfp pilus assembly protein FimV
MKRTKQRNQNVRLYIAIAVVAAVLAVLAWHVHSSKTAAVKPAVPSPSASATPTAEAGPGKTGSAASGPESSGATPTAAPTVVSNPSHPVSTLAKPTGDLLNVGCVSLTKADQTSECPYTPMDSTCLSVPGASCYIQTTLNGRVVKVSQAKVIPNDGTDGVDLPWTASSLSDGTWSVAAVATLNGQTAVSGSEPLKVKN